MAKGSAREDQISRALAGRLVSTLDDRPFAPTARQLHSVAGGDLIPGQEAGPLARIAAGRYAGLVADHVVEDVTADGAAGAYVRIWLCARQAFLRSLDSPAGVARRVRSRRAAEGGAGRVGPS